MSHRPLLRQRVVDTGCGCSDFSLQFNGGRDQWFLIWYKGGGISVKTIIYYMPLKTIIAFKNESFTRQTIPSKENALPTITFSD